MRHVWSRQHSCKLRREDCARQQRALHRANDKSEYCVLNVCSKAISLRTYLGDLLHESNHLIIAFSLLAESCEKGLAVSRSINRRRVPACQTRVLANRIYACLPLTLQQIHISISYIIQYTTCRGHNCAWQCDNKQYVIRPLHTLRRG